MAEEEEEADGGGDDDGGGRDEVVGVLLLVVPLLLLLLLEGACVRVKGLCEDGGVAGGEASQRLFVISRQASTDGSTISWLLGVPKLLSGCKTRRGGSTVRICMEHDTLATRWPWEEER